MAESLVARWGWELYDARFGVWLPRRVRFTSLREAHEHVARASALGLVARIVDYNPPRLVGAAPRELVQ
jgi:hypothetical protein